MTTTINGRTPEEIKKGLELCIGNSDLSEDYCEKCPYIPDASCRDTLEIDALACIQQLENHIGELTEKVKQLERERDELLQKNQQLEARNDKLVAEATLFEEAVAAGAKMQRERDAAVKDLKSVVASNYFNGNYCKLCKYNEPDGQCHHRCIPYSNEWGWEWRGVQEVQHG